MLARAEQRGGNGKRALTFERLDRGAGGDPAVQRDLDHIVRRFGCVRHRLGNGGDHVVRRDALPRGGRCIFGHADDFECARPIGQAADETTFL
jgi:hypothetical protein